MFGAPGSWEIAHFLYPSRQPPARMLPLLNTVFLLTEVTRHSAHHCLLPLQQRARHKESAEQMEGSTAGAGAPAQAQGSH